jgi:hypothetical protein
MLAGTALCLVRSGACAALGCLAALAVLQLASPWAVLPAAACGAAAYIGGLVLLGDEFAGRLLQVFHRSNVS